ncbi:PX domain containing protein/BAR superfamily/vacuolar targeting protein Atg24, putative [Blumeria hordei DH14]|uniref:Sorting nexin-4 n=1 Tax=Blumeria graminis f. sp. hordei (strain DH14) TaxID=546991 RepID=N1JC03_BLUG1|nr:PX domain containing protein/BAR superfamily/vacuolar targeting protein Atg24, putative [Blumeria hordei DH14]
MDGQDEFADISWQSPQAFPASLSPNFGMMQHSINESSPITKGDHDQQLGNNVNPVDLTGVGEGILECNVSQPIKENDGTKDSYVSYLVTTNTTFQSFQKPTTTVRRRFTDFVFLYKTLAREYPTCAVPPVPEKNSMAYVRGDRFGPDFTERRAKSLSRFLLRLTLHPTLRRSALLIIFLESIDWNATMKIRPQRGSLGGGSDAGGSVFDGLTDTFINAFAKVHKPDKRFTDVREKSDKMDEDLIHIEKIVARVSRREGDIETDLKDLADQFQHLILLEPEVKIGGDAFVEELENTSLGLGSLRKVWDHDYLGSLRDMLAYSSSLKNLLKAREQKQLDFEQLTEYLNKSTGDRDVVANPHGGGGHIGASGFLARKIEDVRGVDHEQSRKERLRKLELRIQALVGGVEEAKRVTEAFDEEVVREVADFERIKRVEFKMQLGRLADANVEFYGGVIERWETYIKSMEATGASIA